MTLPEPDFVERDPAALTEQLITDYENYTGRKLQPAQVERLIIDLISYRESLVRVAIQEAAKQNLLAFARFPMLDYLGELLGVVRLPEASALTTIRFTLSAAQPGAIIVPAGTRVRSGDGLATFVTTAPLEIEAGQLAGEVAAQADAPGEAANGYVSGQIATLLDPVAFVATAVNISVTYGGRARETDDRLRDRIREAPERFSVAGPVGAYSWHAMSAHQSIIDAAVLSPQPGTVRVHILTDEGLPSAELLDLVHAQLSDDKVRPLTDTVQVAPPDRVPYTITGTITLYRDADPDATMEAVNRAAAAFASERRRGLGRDLVPSQCIAALSVAGVYRVQLITPEWQELGPSQWADCTAITLTIAGVADG
ncbi:baseplate J/gp47 family protein [Paracoccus sp. P2]|uniref:baseplate assembly protein n=1 Tax=Paracoccus sp. P2 TaxID=3248840 RepID=UPI00391EED8C